MDRDEVPGCSGTDGVSASTVKGTDPVTVGRSATSPTKLQDDKKHVAGSPSKKKAFMFIGFMFSYILSKRCSNIDMSQSCFLMQLSSDKEMSRNQTLTISSENL